MSEDTPEASTGAAASAPTEAEPEGTAGAEHHDHEEHAARKDVATAMRNAVKLGLSLMATWAVALGVRFILPRFLGPERFGQYTWAESTAALAFIFAGLGLNTYIQREVSVKPSHASDFFGGVLVARLTVMALLFLSLYGYALGVERDPEVHLAVVVFGLTQALIVTNESLAALLQASTKVGKLAVANVAAKLVWGVGVVAVVQVTHRYPLLALPMFLSELLKAMVLWPSVRKEVGLELRVDAKVTKAVLITCIPFFVNTISYTMGNKLDVALLKSLATDATKGIEEAAQAAKVEVGLYGAAQNLASLAMLLAPLESWVITPLLTRALKRSEDEFFAILRRAVEGILVVAIPATMMISLGAPFWVRLTTGSKYLDAAAALQQLAPSFVFTYAAVLFATALIIMKRSWSVTLISLSRLMLQPILMWLVVPWAHKKLGVGGAGIGDAFCFTFLELYVSIVFLATLGRRAIDKRLVFALVASLAAYGAAYGTHKALTPHLKDATLVVDGLVYVIVLFATRGVRVADVKAVIGMIRNRRNLAG
ncbi:MAG: oligosaccharide flippase family protein [Polyangiaceae bacterium]